MYVRQMVILLFLSTAAVVTLAQEADATASTQVSPPSLLRLVKSDVADGGDHGDVFMTSPAPYTTTGVLLQAKPAWPDIIAKTGSNTVSSAFGVNDSSDSRLFTVRSDGNVGIGAAAPVAALHVYRASGAHILVGSSSSDPMGSSQMGVAVNNGIEKAFFGAQTGLGFVGTITNTSFGIVTNNVTKLLVTASGNVGIGTLAPAYTLDVNGNSRISGSLLSGGITSSGASTVATDVTTVNPILTLRVGGVDGYYPTINFNSETNARIGSVFGWKNSGFIVQSGLNHSILFRVNDNAYDSMVVNAAGNVGIGTSAPTTKLHVVGDANFTGTVTGGSIQATYQDVAEWVPTVNEMPAGTVVVLDAAHTNHVTASSRSYDTRVAGVVSERPGLILGEAGDSKAMVATTGRVRVRVDATGSPIAIGDLLVTSDVSGMAMRSVPVAINGRTFHQPGTLLGKALEPLESGQGEILVLLSLQ